MNNSGLFIESVLSRQIKRADEKILAEGVVDYIGFSYYMSDAVKHGIISNIKTVGSATENSIKNPCVKASDWGWQNITEQA